MIDVTNPPHYRSHPSGLECIEVTEHLRFCLGNVVKYIWREAHKGGDVDRAKALWYARRALGSWGAEATPEDANRLVKDIMRILSDLKPGAVGICVAFEVDAIAGEHTR